MSAAAEPVAWTLDVVEDVQVPGWFFVPAGLAAAEQEQWLAECREALVEITEAQGLDAGELDSQRLRSELLGGLEARAASPSLALFQVWPAGALGSVLCHVSVLASSDLPDWTGIGAAVHPIEAAHLGPGLQCSIRRTVEVDKEPVELASVHLVFDDGETTLMLSLTEALAPVVAYALPGFLTLMESIRMVADDGRPFRSLPPSGLVAEEPWQLEEEQR
ncbi:hypothetical protein LQF12_01775 [Ruania suaedae]|uniref:hypothetical protein n=1 Tax=Ruania suaedae TaxID=2897774 RepID=UPI001E416BC3|nr:hypothetical protein [Ruania suaedae]UFU03366.1 hypothetical protein LQF12_01775 [Ruania suaedae]